jgi:hypothetical protein
MTRQMTFLGRLSFVNQEDVEEESLAYLRLELRHCLEEMTMTMKKIHHLEIFLCPGLESRTSKIRIRVLTLSRWMEMHRKDGSEETGWVRGMYVNIR